MTMHNFSKRHLEYERWIRRNQPANAWGCCATHTQQMVKAFPELRRVGGHYVCPIQGRLPHWWCVAPDGRVVDPTRMQFVSRGQGRYEPHEGPEPIRRCLNCGADIFVEDWVCNAACRTELLGYQERETAHE